MEYNKFIVEKVSKKETIYTYLKKIGISENYIKNLRKKQGFIKLNDNVAYTNTQVKSGDVIYLIKNPIMKKDIPKCDLKLNILYEDENIIVVNKPAGLPCIPTKSHITYNLIGALINYYKDVDFVPRIINRLDKDTAGIVIIAKHSYISNLLNNAKIHKDYYAICQGSIKENATINKNILTTQNEFGYNNLKREINPQGKAAITYVYPIKNYKTNTLCKVNIVHGRTHQIRVHMSSIGHPLIGDCIYGKNDDRINHTALVCKRVKFVHPLTKSKYNFTIPLPNDFKLLLS